MQQGLSVETTTIVREGGPNLFLRLSVGTSVEQSQPLLFLHGYTAGAWIYDDWLRAFNDEGYPSYALDLRGHGASAGREAVRKARFDDYVSDAQSALEFIQSKHTGEVVVIGHSLGSLLARELASRAQLKGMALLGFGDLKSSMTTFMKWMFRNFPFQTLAGMMSGRSSKMWANFEPQYLTLFDGQPRGEVADFVAMFQQQPESDKVFMDLMGRAIATDRNGASVFIMAGERDPIVTEDSIGALAKVYSADPIIIPGAAHDLTLGAYAAEARNHLSQWIGSL